MISTSKFKEFGVPEYSILFIGGIYALTSHNPTITFVAILFPLVLIKLLWKTNEAPFLFFALLTQSLAVVVKVFYSNAIDVDFTQVHDNPTHIVSAFYLSLIGLFSISLGMHLVIKTFDLRSLDYIEAGKKFSNKKLIRIYIISAIVYPTLFALSFRLGGLQQPIYELLQFKWAIFVILLVNSFATGNVKNFLMIFFIEVILSFTGYFSAFKDYFFIFFIGLLIVSRNRLKPSYAIALLLIAGAGLYIMVIWEHVKPEYRLYLSSGQAAQVSTKSNGESLSKLYSLIAETNQEGIADGFYKTVNRLSYIDFLSATEAQVPSNIAHTNGSLWSGALERVFEPRILFPNKKAIDDSEKARLYTGHDYAGADRGASISLGYIAESYVDFGEIGMHVPLFLFGILIGLIYKSVLMNSPNILVGTALVVPLYIEIYNYEKALDKVVGGVFMYFIIYLVVKRFLLKKFLKSVYTDESVQSL